MQFDLFPVRPPPAPPVTKTVTAFKGTEDEIRVEITVKGRRRRIVSMRRLPRE